MIIFSRHGQTAANRDGRLLGRHDAPLTEHGAAQAAAMARALGNVALGNTAPTEVYSSPLRRAITTADVIADAVGVEVRIDERLVELDYGEWDGRAHDEISTEDWLRWRDDPHFAPPGGESLATVRARVVTFAEEHIASDAQVVAVSHVSPIKSAFAWALGMSDSVAFRAHLDLASFTRVARGPLLFSFNETGHLSELSAAGKASG
ncbi:MAG: histidine phosphatase family protein [Acidimicrobiia bacterium]|nr:histidine phosphatase family protein [Acidimicrobiia bacterium]